MLSDRAGRAGTARLYRLSSRVSIGHAGPCRPALPSRQASGREPCYLSMARGHWAGAAPRSGRDRARHFGDVRWRVFFTDGSVAAGRPCARAPSNLGTSTARDPRTRSADTVSMPVRPARLARRQRIAFGQCGNRDGGEPAFPASTIRRDRSSRPDGADFGSSSRARSRRRTAPHAVTSLSCGCSRKPSS